jgi:PAS domain-containing protein
MNSTRMLVAADGGAVAADSFEAQAQRLRAGQALRESDERYRNLFPAEFDALCRVDAATGRFFGANPVAQRM